MLTRLDLRSQLEPSGAERDRNLRKTLPRAAATPPAPTDEVAAIIDEVRAGDDAALRELTKRFDDVEIDELRVPKVSVDAALRDLDPLLREALQEACEAVMAFHRSTKPEDSTFRREGVDVRAQWKAVERAGCYAPGGLAQYPSSVIMTALPARVAGVGQVVLCTPPGPDGNIPRSVLAAAALAEVDEVYAVGGVQAIAAMAYGTESLARTDVIAGSGNRYVTEARRQLASVVGMPAASSGPSEVVVIADATAPPEMVAIDLLVQAEHGPGGLAWLVTWSEDVAIAIEEAVGQMVLRSSRREQIEATLGTNGYSVLVDDAQAALDVANAVAPEHLELATIDPEVLLPHVRHAGVTFTGVYAPAAIGDYMAGPSHILPVGGSARFASVLGVRDFMRHQQIVSLDEAALARIGPHVAAIAESEGFDAHAMAVRMRSHP